MLKKIAICICTYKRPQSLDRLLQSLTFVNHEFNVTIVIVDNDLLGSAKKTCVNYKKELNILYDIEIEKGLSNARNKCVELAKEIDAEYIVFLDDDQIVINNDWLNQLMSTSEKYKANLVTGPEIPLFEPTIKKSIRKSNFFSYAKQKTGTKLSHTATGNTLIKLSLIDKMKPVFNTDYNFSGGEDTDLFERLTCNNEKIIWSENAAVYECIPANRATIKYIFKRSYNGSLVYNKIMITYITNPLIKKIYQLNRLAKGIMKIIKGIIFSLSSLVYGNYKFVQGVSTLGKGIGDIAGIFKTNSSLYKN